MGNRGRPKTPDVLTPREYEVLALLREGLSNREISERLGISLAGAKFHVSEIIGKLGVEGREEAAAWKPIRDRRWAFAPVATVQSWSHALSLLAAPKIVPVSAVAVLAVGLVGRALVMDSSHGTGNAAGSLSSAEPTPTPWDDPCAGLPADRCISFPNKTVSLASLDEASELTSFAAVLPDYVPAGYERTTLGYSWPGNIESDSQSGFTSKGPGAPFEELFAEYQDSTGSKLLVTQGYGSSHASFYERAPDEWRGEQQIGLRRVYWYQGGPEYEYREGPLGQEAQFPIEGSWNPRGLIVVYWEVRSSTRGIVWEIAPDGTKRVFEGGGGYPFSYMIASRTLPLDELLRVAESVSP